MPPLNMTLKDGKIVGMEQYPAFAFRIMVDIASKGRSPAINDPTTVASRPWTVSARNPDRPQARYARANHYGNHQNLLET